MKNKKPKPIHCTVFATGDDLISEQDICITGDFFSDAEFVSIPSLIVGGDIHISAPEGKEAIFFADKMIAFGDIFVDDKAFVFVDSEIYPH